VLHQPRKHATNDPNDANVACHGRDKLVLRGEAHVGDRKSQGCEQEDISAKDERMLDQRRGFQDDLVSSRPQLGHGVSVRVWCGVNPSSSTLDRTRQSCESAGREPPNDGFA
jgi:hypothetical protein